MYTYTCAADMQCTCILGCLKVCFKMQRSHIHADFRTEANGWGAWSLRMASRVDDSRSGYTVLEKEMTPQNQVGTHKDIRCQWIYCTQESLRTWLQVQYEMLVPYFNSANVNVECQM